MRSHLKTLLALAVLCLCVAHGLAADPKGEASRSTWARRARATIEKLIAERGKGSPGYDASRPPIATLDWDNTMIYNDIGEATFLYLIDEMKFRFDDTFWQLIPEEKRPALREAYQVARDLPPGARAASPAYQAYRRILWSCYDYLCRTQGKEIGYPWVAKIMSGLTPEEVREAARRALRREMQRPLGRETFGAAEPEESDPHTGIRYYSEMADLIAKLREAGFEIWIVSASTQWIVEVAAEKLGIPPRQVLGMLPGLDQSGHIRPQMDRITYRAGKAEAVRAAIGRPPDFAAGDSSTDTEMLQAATGPRLVIERCTNDLTKMARRLGRKKRWLIQPAFGVP